MSTIDIHNFTKELEDKLSQTIKPTKVTPDLSGSGAHRKSLLEMIYRNTHSDYKGVLPDGTRVILVCRGATCLVTLEELTDDEIAQRLPKRK